MNCINRKRTLKCLITFIFSVTFCYAQTDDKDLVLKSFDGYKNSILTDKGEEAVNFVDSRTMKYYDNILEKVKRADSVEVDALGLIDKITVLTYRLKASDEELSSFSGKDLFIFAIDNGMVGKSSIVNSTLGEVSISEDFASAEFIINGRVTSFSFHFYREDNIWRIDITNLFELGTFAFKKLIEDSGQEENEFILNVLELATGSKPSNKIWKPILE